MQEEAYWNGSSAQCCDTSKGKYKLVKNYKNGVGEAGYACCEIKETSVEERYNTWNGEQFIEYKNIASDWTVVGAINGSCCGKWTSGNEITYSPGGEKIYEEFNHSYSYSIKQNGGVYYCAKDWTTKWIQFSSEDTTNSYINTGYYSSEGQYCTEMEHFYNDVSTGGPPKQCCTTTSGDPAKGTCEYIF